MIRWLRTGQLARNKRMYASEAGYTITETLIVLAVTTMMFAAIAIGFSGRQSKVQFTQSVRDFEGRLESIMSEVINGYYVSPSGSSCRVAGNGPPSFSGPPKPTGTSADCIFVGKILRSSDGPDSTKVSEIKTLVGRRLNTSGADTSTLAEANPVIIAGTADNSLLTMTHSFQLELRRMVRLDTNIQIYGLAFVNKFSGGVNAENTASTSLIDLYGVTSSAPMPLNSVLNTAVLSQMPRGVLLCMRGNGDQRAEITIGTENSQTGVFSTLNTPATGGLCSGS